MPPSTIDCFINSKKVFHLQICDSLQIHKGHDPWHTLYKVLQTKENLDDGESKCIYDFDAELLYFDTNSQVDSFIELIKSGIPFNSFHSD